MATQTSSLTFHPVLAAALAVLTCAPLHAQSLHPAQLDAGESSPVVRSLRRGDPNFRSAPPTASQSLADAFAFPAPAPAAPAAPAAPEPPAAPAAATGGDEVEPVVLGRERWNEGSPPAAPAATPAPTTTGIQELPPIETQQPKPDKELLPLKPPTIPPAVHLHRNFEGKLILKTRTLGYEKDFPYQLLNSNGKRLAFVDVDGVRAVDPLAFRDHRVTILGKLEPIEEGSKNLIIRARLIRQRD